MGQPFCCATFQLLSFFILQHCLPPLSSPACDRFYVLSAWTVSLSAAGGGKKCFRHLDNQVWLLWESSFFFHSKRGLWQTMTLDPRTPEAVPRSVSVTRVSVKRWLRFRLIFSLDASDSSSFQESIGRQTAQIRVDSRLLFKKSRRQLLSELQISFREKLTSHGASLTFPFCEERVPSNVVVVRCFSLIYWAS